MIQMHYPVLLNEVLQMLKLSERHTVVDCTVGLGSHACRFLQVMPADALFLGIDKDKDSLELARKSLQFYGQRCRLIQDDFRNLDTVLDKCKIKKADIFFFDLGVSMYQLKDPERGFSFLKEGPLDMRMDRNSFICAADLVNYLSESELGMILKKFGEERFSKNIARSLVQGRQQDPIMTTGQLRNIVGKAVPKRYHSQRINPATRVFQALRIAVNRELDALEIGLRKAILRLAPQGRIAVITFHSLEDRIVKYLFREYAAKGVLKIINKKVIVPSVKELQENKASRSAKLRVVEGI